MGSRRRPIRGSGSMKRLALPAVLLVLGVAWCAPCLAPGRAASRVVPPAPTRAPAAETSGDTIEARFPPPVGFRRTAVADGSFGAYLRALPLRPEGTPVRLHDGRPKRRQDVHAAV